MLVAVAGPDIDGLAAYQALHSDHSDLSLAEGG
jgi:hypothetical protein